MKYSKEISTTKFVFTIVLIFCLGAQGASAVASDVGSVRIPMQVLVKSLRRDFGAMRGSYLMPDALVSEQILESMGVPDQTFGLSDGNYLVSGCRVHSCDEKSAIIANSDGTPMASALIHFHCHVAKHGVVNCDVSPRLTLFLKPSSDQVLLSQELEAWASSKAAIGSIETRLLR